jgi:hypothetical protein
MPSGIEGRCRWELGSEFHWHNLFQAPFLAWPQEARWYMLARHALASLLTECARARPTLWVPSYFCGEVIDFCGRYCDVREYRDDPRWPYPDWDSLRPQAQHFVLAVNYFGIRDGLGWKHWRERNECRLVEDHTQDPFSSWCQDSTADYAFVSLRKTLPVPDGALLWSPRRLALPQLLHAGDWAGSAMKLAAMLRKSQYLDGYGHEHLKTAFRNLQAQGEDRLRHMEVSGISPYSYALLSEGFPVLWRRQRELNARSLSALLVDWNAADLLFRAWPSGSVPFALILVFASRSRRDEFQARMIQKRVYCPVHWICRTQQGHALELSSRILSIPIDHRYDENDMKRLADLILESCSPVTSKAEIKAARA